jgi:hypothetical protein
MLNLQVAMHQRFFQLFVLFSFLVSVRLQQAPDQLPRIDVPLPGDEVRGVVGIAGSTDMEEFAFSEVSFGFSPEGAWFSLGRQSAPVKNQIIANWDTTSIPDGTYRIRVVVQKKDGSQVETVVDEIHVSNYSSTGSSGTDTGSRRSTPLPDYDDSVKRTATALPRNPASVTSQDLFSSLRMGVAGTIGLFLLLALYLGMRWLNRRK